jgi:hypothetical protein
MLRRGRRSGLRARAAAVADPLSEQDNVTLQVLALLDGTTVAEQRRLAVRSYASQARRDRTVAQIVSLILAARQDLRAAGSNIVSIRSRRTPDQR